MQLGARLTLIFKICLPLFILVLLRAYPESYALVQDLQQAHAKQADGEHQAAAAAYRQVLAREPWRTQLWEQVGREELAAGRLSEAIDALRAAGQGNALSPDGRFQLAEAYLKQGSPHQAEATWQSLLRAQGPSERVFERLVQVQRAERDYSAAINTLRAWQAFDAQNPHVAFLLGMFLSAVQPDQALPLLTEASQKDASLTPSVQALRRGLAQASTSDNPGYGWLMIGRALGSIDQWDLAEKAFRQAVTVSPNYAEAWGFLGEARYHTGGSGKPELDQASKLAPDSSIVRALLAIYWRRQGQPEKALAYLEAIAAQEPEEPTWQVEIGNTLVETGDLDAAQKAFQKAVDLAPTNTLYWQYLARFSTDNYVDIRGLGLPAARQAVMLSPDDPAALDVMGWTMAKLGDSASAERFLQRALERDATYATACLHLGQLYLEQQDESHAHLYLKQAVNLAGESPVGVIARRLLQRYYGEGS